MVCLALVEYRSHRVQRLPCLFKLLTTMPCQITNGHANHAAKFEVLAVPPLFLQESGHSGGIPVESGGMKFGRRPC